MKFKEYDELNLPLTAQNILEYWQKNDIFKKSVDTKLGCTPFIFFEGPPSANGLPGIHHVMARTIKDIFCRYKTLKGFRVRRKAGWDTHGLPVELGVEKELGITKEDIGKKISVEHYNNACKQAVMKYTDIWNDLTEKMGYWVDTKDPYITYQSKYMESVWWLLKQIYEKGLLYKGYTIQPYSPKAGTGLSSHELNQPGCYRDVTDTTVVCQFKALDGENSVAKAFDYKGDMSEFYLLAWTTTPWTLPSNTALTVGKNIDYVLIRTFNQYTFSPVCVVLAKDLIPSVFAGKFSEAKTDQDFVDYKPSDKKIPYAVVGQCKGEKLLEIRYEQLLNYALPYQNPENAFRVIAGDFVTTEDGTGIVHTAPTFGADDAKVAKEAKPEVPPMLVIDENENLVPLVDLQGRFLPQMGDLAGKYVKNEYYEQGQAPEKSVDVEIAIKLKEENKAFKVEKYVHNYPHCWRTDKPVLYYPLDSWFIKVTEVKDRLYELNKKINWKPKATGEGRFGNWLQNANDWNLSRSRYWGIPLPIWRSEDGKEEIIIGSVEELKKEIEKAIEKGFIDKDPFPDFKIGDMSQENYQKIDLHKNIVDKIVLVSPSGKPMKRESDLIDVWFDSGSMPYAQWHYPFENKEMVEEEWKTADFIAEGVDQTRGWFYTLHTIAGIIFGDVAYKNVVSNGLVLDKNGQKMSKRLANAVEPFQTLKQYGADPTRWYMISNANPWDNLKFDTEAIEEVKRKFFGTLYNTYSFFALYANLDSFNYSEDEIPKEERPEIDRWILSELNTLIKNVDQAYLDYEPTRATRLISDFVQEHLSNWFVRLSRRRFWKGEYGKDKISAYQTLYTCLLNVAKISSPVAPFYMDRLYKDLVEGIGKGKESVHLENFPEFDPKMIDERLQRKMEMAQKISSLVLSLRKKEMIKVRQPLKRIMIPALSQEDKQDILSVADLIKAEVNVKEINLIDDDSQILVKQIKPNFKTLGPRFGKEMKEIAKAIASIDKDGISMFEKNGFYDMDFGGGKIRLELSDVEIISQDIEGWLVANSQNLVVALDTTITQELKNEGIARELVNRIQNIRKDSGFEVNDKIVISLEAQQELEKAVRENEGYIKAETLAREIVFQSGVDAQKVEFDGIKTRIKVVRVNG